MMMLLLLEQQQQHHHQRTLSSCTRRCVRACVVLYKTTVWRAWGLHGAFPRHRRLRAATTAEAAREGRRQRRGVASEATLRMSTVVLYKTIRRLPRIVLFKTTEGSSTVVVVIVRGRGGGAEAARRGGAGSRLVVLYKTIPPSTYRLVQDGSRLEFACFGKLENFQSTQIRVARIRRILVLYAVQVEDPPYACTVPCSQ